MNKITKREIISLIEMGLISQNWDVVTSEEVAGSWNKMIEPLINRLKELGIEIDTSCPICNGLEVTKDSYPCYYCTPKDFALQTEEWI